eukprot:scaffold4207_cov63-Phaeocystis_antarctica.AAC.3
MVTQSASKSEGLICMRPATIVSHLEDIVITPNRNTGGGCGAPGGAGGVAGGEGDVGGCGGGCGLAPTCRSCTPSSARPVTMAYVFVPMTNVATRRGSSSVLHAFVDATDHDGVRARTDDKGGDAARTVEHVEAVHAVRRAAHRDGAARVAHIDQLHAIVVEARDDGVRAGADDKGGDALRAVELGEAVHAVRRAAYRDGAAWVAHIDQLHAIVDVAHGDGVRARADDKGGETVRAVELVEAIHAVRRAAHRDRAAWVAHIDQLHAVVILSCHDGVRAEADDKGGNGNRAVELVEAVHAVRRTAHRDGAAWVAHIDQLHAVVR